jgi:hypothetical protein
MEHNEYYQSVDDKWGRILGAMEIVEINNLRICSINW